MALKTSRKTLREIARSLEDSKPSLSPEELANRLYDEIPAGDREEYLKDALHVVAYTLLADFRRKSWKSVVQNARGQGKASKLKAPIKRVQVVVDADGNEKRVPTPEAVQHKSYKARLIKSDWDEFLEKNLPTDDGYIKVADATEADVRRAAAIRRSQGEALHIEAEKYENLANVMHRLHAATVSLLSPEDVKGQL